MPRLAIKYPPWFPSLKVWDIYILGGRRNVISGRTQQMFRGMTQHAWSILKSSSESNSNNKLEIDLLLQVSDHQAQLEIQLQQRFLVYNIIILTISKRHMTTATSKNTSSTQMSRVLLWGPIMFNFA